MKQHYERLNQSNFICKMSNFKTSRLLQKINLSHGRNEYCGWTCRPKSKKIGLANSDKMPEREKDIYCIPFVETFFNGPKKVKK